jgi:hypothetical protein
MNWHVETIGAKLTALRRGKIRRVIINMPPRHLKSHLASANHLDRPGPVTSKLTSKSNGAVAARPASGVIFTANSEVPDNDAEAPTPKSSIAVSRLLPWRLPVSRGGVPTGASWTIVVDFR